MGFIRLSDTYHIRSTLYRLMTLGFVEISGARSRGRRSRPAAHLIQVPACPFFLLDAPCVYRLICIMTSYMNSKRRLRARRCGARRRGRSSSSFEGTVGPWPEHEMIVGNEIGHTMTSPIIMCITSELIMAKQMTTRRTSMIIVYH